MKKHPFVILTNPRSGSSWLVNMLRSRDDLDILGELFNTPEEKPSSANKQKRAKYLLPRWSKYKKNNKYNIPIYTLFEYLDKVYSVSDYTGFKLMFLHMAKTPSIIPYLLFKRVKVVHLQRDNVLDIVISKEALKVRKIAHSKDDVKQIKLFLDPQKTLSEIKFLLFIEKMTSLFCALMPMKTIRVSYEELVNDPSSWQRIQQFICPDREIRELNCGDKKLNKLPKREMIENFDELYKVLDKAGLAHLCEDAPSTLTQTLP